MLYSPREVAALCNYRILWTIKRTTILKGILVKIFQLYLKNLWTIRHLKIYPVFAREKATRSSVGQQIPFNLENLKIHYHLHKSLPCVTALSPINPFHVL
jgi:hypothetical protein